VDWKDADGFDDMTDTQGSNETAYQVHKGRVWQEMHSVRCTGVQQRNVMVA